MKRSIKKFVLGLVFGAMLVPSSYAWAKTGRTNTAGQWKMEEKHWTFLNEKGNKLTGWIVSRMVLSGRKRKYEDRMAS
mgnify:CR=1 FL=1